MKGRYIELHKAFSNFHKLNLSVLYPQMTHGEMVILKVISDFGDGMNISQLVNELCLAPPAVSRTLGSLEEKGLIERKVNKSDRRNTLVELTEAGRVANQEATAVVEAYMTRIMERVDDDEIRKIVDGVNRIYEIAREELEILKRENK